MAINETRRWIAVVVLTRCMQFHAVYLFIFLSADTPKAPESMQRSVKGASVLSCRREPFSAIDHKSLELQTD